MNEADWRRGQKPQPLIRYLIGTDHPRVQAVEAFPSCRTSDRKLRLFACACYARLRHVLSDPRAHGHARGCWVVDWVLGKT